MTYFLIGVFSVVVIDSAMTILFIRSARKNPRLASLAVSRFAYLLGLL